MTKDQFNARLEAAYATFADAFDEAMSEWMAAWDAAKGGHAHGAQRRYQTAVWRTKDRYTREVAAARAEFDAHILAQVGE